MRLNRLTVTRRAFLKAAAAAAVAPYVVPESVLGAGAPSRQLTMGCIGVGRQGSGNMRAFLERVRVVAVCDVDAHRAKAAAETVEAYEARRRDATAFKGCDAYNDFRDLVARPDIDTCLICTPDHWHVLAALAAARAGKDMFVEKPLTLTIPEGRALSDTVRRYGRILQVGSQQRSDGRFRFACELVRSGRIGKLHTVTVILDTDPGTTPQPVMPVPEGLDYDFWLGPAPWAPYTEERVHPQQGYGRPGWLRIADYSGGMMTGWGSHHNDIAQWGMDTERTGPVEIQGRAEFPKDGLWDVHGKFRVEATYAGGVRLTMHNGSDGIRFEGSDGWVFVNRSRIDAQPKAILKEPIGAGEVRLYASSDHKGNFLDSVRRRCDPIADVEIGHRSASLCHLANIAMRLGRKLRWDPGAETFVDDAEANRMMVRAMRSPWAL
ncbi:MAG: Gfo/Idh/MocA family oxidoreductase [Planctomycetes bacterium]|nr:Gfo/Idh/MocA family oxidoreductase [Planctomycetota bacterium]